MHEKELEIDEYLVHALLEAQCPHWANLPLTSVSSSGTDHALYRLGDEYIVRLPRIEWIPGSLIKSINKEYEWVPKIARFLKIPISEPVFKGNPDKFYPWPWTITRWNKGHNPDFEIESEYEQLAEDIACFLNDMHGIKLTNGPVSRRGIPLKELDVETRKAIGELEGKIDTYFIASLWRQLLNVPSWNKTLVWLHGDLLPGNILVQNNRLSAVIDFTDVGIGDPACDLIIAWSLFNPNSRQIFKENLKHVDDDTWERGRGWALSIALIMLPYYIHSNPVLTALARRMIKNVSCDYEKNR
ncbi:aminoglycoside phosphotransferase family protein [Aquicella siphonis]|nr:aminoglycoside phosphotransferase family protein [Aquicella siphonis]